MGERSLDQALVIGLRNSTVVLMWSTQSNESSQLENYGREVIRPGDWIEEPRFGLNVIQHTQMEAAI